MGPLLIIVGITLGITLLLLALMYNGFVSRRNRMRNAFASIDVQLKKRWDLVPQVVEAVRAYASHEKGVFENVTRARRGIEAVEADSPERFDYEQDLGAGLSRVMLLAEDYPDLKAGEQFLNLQRNLTEVESQIAAARRAFNATVTAWNEGVEMFPGSVMAGICGFPVQSWFETPESQRKVTDVQV